MELMRSDDSPHLQALELEAARNLEPSFLRASRTAFEHEQSLMPAQVFADAAELGVIRNPEGNFFEHIKSGLSESDPSITPMGNVLSPEDANKKYGIDDREQKILNFTKPVSDEEASLLRDKKIKELARLDVLDRVKGFGDNLALLPATMLAELRDPIGFASIFIPGTASRKFLTGFLSGGAASAVILTPAAIRDTEFQGTFESQQLVLSILAGGTLSGGISKGLGTLDKFREVYKRRKDKTFGKATETPKAPENIKDAPERVDDVLEESSEALEKVAEEFDADIHSAMVAELSLPGKSPQEAIAFTNQMRKAKSEADIAGLEKTQMDQIEKLKKAREELITATCNTKKP